MEFTSRRWWHSRRVSSWHLLDSLNPFSGTFWWSSFISFMENSTKPKKASQQQRWKFSKMPCLVSWARPSTWSLFTSCLNQSRASRRELPTVRITHRSSPRSETKLPREISIKGLSWHLLMSRQAPWWDKFTGSKGSNVFSRFTKSKLKTVMLGITPNKVIRKKG